MLESIKYTAYSLDTLPEAAQKPLMPETPAPLKLMAAKGLLPLQPAQTLVVWFQLALSGDESIVKTVQETVASFDEHTLVDLAKSALDAQLLDWLVKTARKPSVTEAIILNDAVSDATIMDLAAVASKDLADLIANNHTRLLRSPEIIEKLYSNASVRMATIDRILTLAKENNVELSGMKALQDAINSAELQDDTPGMSDEEFEQILAQSAQESAKEEEEAKKEEAAPLHTPRPAQADPEIDEKTGKKLTHQQLVDRMNAPQRVRLALLGSREDRTILLRDSRRIVYMSVMQSPKLSIGEVSQIAANKGMSEDIIGYIAKRRDWTRNYPILVSLCNNPKCPLGEALAFIKQLRLNDLKMLTKSKAISATLARQALMLTRTKST